MLVEGVVSKYQPVLSGAPEWSLLGWLLFLVYINDLNNNKASHLLTYADDTKLFRKVDSYDNTGNLHDNLDELVK